MAMRKDALGLLICLTCGFFLSGCVAELLGPELASEAAIGLEAEAAAVGAEAELGGVAVEGEVEAGLLRTRPGAMSSFLERVTEGGETRPTLAIDRAGRITIGNRLVASLEGEGEIVSNIQGRKYLVGRIVDGRIWEVTREGRLASAVGEIGGYIPSDGLFLRAEPNVFSARIGILRSDLLAEVLRVENGWYEIRLRSGATGWVRAPFVAILTTLYSAAHRREDDRDTADERLFLTSGRVLTAAVSDETDGAVVVVGSDGKSTVLDRSLLSSKTKLQWDWASHTEHTTLNNGTILLATLRDRNESAAQLELPDGQRIILDSSLLKGDPAAAEEAATTIEVTEPDNRNETETRPEGRETAKVESCLAEVSVKPGDATVYLDDKFVGTGRDLHESGLEIGLGDHSLAAVRPGYKSRKFRLDVTDCEDLKVRLALVSDIR